MYLSLSDLVSVARYRRWSWTLSTSRRGLRRETLSSSWKSTTRHSTATRWWGLVEYASISLWVNMSSITTKTVVTHGLILWCCYTHPGFEGGRKQRSLCRRSKKDYHQNQWGEAINASPLVHWHTWWGRCLRYWPGYLRVLVSLWCPERRASRFRTSGTRHGWPGDPSDPHWPYGSTGSYWLQGKPPARTKGKPFPLY